MKQAQNERMQELRTKSSTERLTLEEMGEIVKALRGDRVSACFASKGARSKKKKVDETVDELDQTELDL